MNIRKAEERDIPRLGDLLLQVCRVHHQGRPDLFRRAGRASDGPLPPHSGGGGRGRDRPGLRLLRGPVPPGGDRYGELHHPVSE